MVQTTVEKHISNERAGQSGGISERMLHAASGLRCSPLSVELQSDDEEIVADILIAAGQSNETAVALGDADAFIDSAFYGGAYKNNGILRWPSTLCLTWLFGSVTIPARAIQWRVTGSDQFGNRIEETNTITPENSFTLHSAVASLYSFRAWTSNIFASVDTIEIAKSDTTTGTIIDNFRIGTCYKWDRADESVAIYNDATGGTFTLTLTIDGATDVTGALAFDATPAVIRTALLGLTVGGVTIDDVEVVAGTLIVPSGFDELRVIKFMDPVLGRQSVTMDGTLLTGGGGVGVVSGEDFFNRDACAIAIPREILPAGPVGASGNLYPEVLAATLIVPKLATVSTTHTILSTTVTTNLVLLATPHGFAVGESFPVFLNSVTAMTPAEDVACIGTATTDHEFSVTVDISTTGAVSGTAAIIGNTGHNLGSPGESEVVLQDAGGTRAVPTAAGFRLGISEGNMAGSANKFQLFLDGEIGAKLRLRDGRSVRVNHQNIDQFGPKHTIQFWVRTTKGTGRMASDVRTYPQG